MSSTNKTQHYELNQFVGSDIPSWLVDYNGDMRKIDTALGNIASAVATDDANITSLDGRVTTAEGTISSHSNTLNTLNTDVANLKTSTATNTTNISGLTTRVGAVETSVSNINSEIGTTSISGIGDGTITGAISALNGSNNVVTLTGTTDSSVNIWKTINYPSGFNKTNTLILACYIELGSTGSEYEAVFPLMASSTYYPAGIKLSDNGVDVQVGNVGQCDKNLRIFIMKL